MSFTHLSQETQVKVIQGSEALGTAPRKCPEVANIFDIAYNSPCRGSFYVQELPETILHSNAFASAWVT